MRSKTGHLALVIAASGAAATLAAIGHLSAPRDNGIEKSDRLRMEITVACGTDIVSDTGTGCETIAGSTPWTRPGEAFLTTAHQDGANTTVLVKRRIER